MYESTLKSLIFFFQRLFALNPLRLSASPKGKSLKIRLPLVPIAINDFLRGIHFSKILFKFKI